MDNQRFRNYVWVTLAYTQLVILWGAVVRATGSGAGCGSHWPTCNGEIIARPESVETMIELSHRLTSTLSGFLVMILLFWAYRAFPKGHLVRRGAVVSFFFILMEGLIGALLVRLELVGDNSSIERAVMIAIHLVNTFFLIAAIVLTGWWSKNKEFNFRFRDTQITWLLIIGAIGFFLLGGSGAITALGDTLFPSESLIEGFREDFSPGANFLIRLRVYHPIIGIILGIYLLIASNIILERLQTPSVRRFTNWLRWLFGIELAVGVVNVLLLAPVWMQVIHLLLADLIWLAAVLLANEALTTEPLPMPTHSDSELELEHT
ncbi:MAG: COX15/CtaA family protein [Chloroflexota bacterium]